MSNLYEARGGRSYREGKDGPELLANFCAWITKEVRYVDGIQTRTVFTVAGCCPAPTEDDPEATAALPAVEVPAEEYESLGWVMSHWGASCVIRPGNNVKADLRTMIQLARVPERETVYRHTGWTKIGGKPAYLHTGGAITAKGNDPRVRVLLPPELARYNLATDLPPRDCVRASLLLLDVARPDLTWPLLAATLAPLYGPCDFAVHVTGRTGSFKSELASLFQSHYGAEMDARRLPGSWSSTGNSLEAMAYYTCNAVFVVDDFVPGGSSYQQKTLQAQADKIIRAQGNQAGRSRLTDAASLQQTMYPRGLIFSTGEDTPEGHSVRARMLIRELAGGEIDADDLTAAQKRRPYYCGTVAWLAQTLCQVPADIKDRTEELRGELRDIGHSRTPGMLGRLIAVAEDFLDRAGAAGFLSDGEVESATADAQRAILDAGREQQSYLEDADPVDQFTAAIRQTVAAAAGHFRSLSGGVPMSPEILGWTSEASSGEIAVWKARGPTIGWVDVDEDLLYLDIAAGFGVVKKVAGADALPLSKQTLFKRLKDAGKLLRTDDGRQRNTVRVTAQGHPRQVLALSLSDTLEQEESLHDE